MNTITKIIIAAFTAMLICTTAAAYDITPAAPVPYNLQDVYNDGVAERRQAIQDGYDKADQQRELERTIQKQIRKHEQCPYGIPKQRERISYGRKPSYNDLPDAYPTEPEQTPSLHPVFVLIVVGVSMLLVRRNQ